MADTYVASIQSASVSAAGILAELLNPGAATAQRMYVSEVDVFWRSGASTSMSFGLGRPGNTPTTGTQVVGIAEADPTAPVAVGATAITGWGTAPTVPAKFLRQGAIASAGGNGVIWTWPPGEELIIAPNDRSKSLVLWCNVIGTATATVLDLTFRWKT